jgi:hypothetical protein|eukprot:COSAG01_NODE_11081_length_2011_cov_1.879707_3_plen_36_part_00
MQRELVEEVPHSRGDITYMDIQLLPGLLVSCILSQ